MSEYNTNILMKMALEKKRIVKEFINNFLGHEPSKEERKQFTIMHSLDESKIYFKGSFIGDLIFNTNDPTPI